MENSPTTPHDDDGEKSSGKKKKKAEALGVFAIEPDKKKDQSAEDIWQKLTLTKRQGGQTLETVPVAELIEIKPDNVPEVSEAEAPLETLSPAEEQFVASEIVAAERQIEANDPVEQVEAPASAVKLFRDKIVSDGLPAEQAFTETLRALGVEPEQTITKESPPLPAPEAEPANYEEPITEEPVGGGAGGAGVPPRHGGDSAGSPGFSESPPAPPASPATAERAEKRYPKEDVVGAAFLGGLVGYLIGRRRGRIKTQKKLLPIQKKLEKQVADLRQDIQQKEVYISKVTREQSRDHRKITEMEQARKKPEQNRPIAMEANQLHGKVAPEKIGQVLVSSEETTPPPADKRPEAPKPRSLQTTEQTAKLSREELLRLSANIRVENTTLRQVYETHLVSEQGLRRLVGEYLQGKDIQKAVRAELVEHEIDFERDPALRDHGRAAAPAITPTDSPTLSALLQKAGVADSQRKDGGVPLATEKLFEHDQQQQHLQHRRFMDVAFVLIILVLLFLVIILIVGRR